MVSSNVFDLSHVSKHASCTRTYLKYVCASTASFSGFFLLQDVADDETDNFSQQVFVDQFLSSIAISWKRCVSLIIIMVYQKRMAFSIVLALVKILPMVSVSLFLVRAWSVCNLKLYTKVFGSYPQSSLVQRFQHVRAEQVTSILSECFP